VGTWNWSNRRDLQLSNGVYLYRMHGVTIRSDVELHASIREKGTDEYPDISIHAAELENNEGVDITRVGSDWERLVAFPDGTVQVTFPDVGLVTISGDGHEIRYCWETTPDGLLGPVLVEGFVLSLALQLRGELVLHASAVRVPSGHTVAICGPSGAGKSTISALMVSGGAEQLADDVLTVRPDQGGLAVVSSGSRAIRLRPAASELQHIVAEQSTSQSVDGRTVLTFEADPIDSVSLDQIWLPCPDRKATEVTAERVASSKAFASLRANYRVELAQTEHRKRAFEHCAWLADRVPVYEVRIPWGPPWSPTLVGELLAMASGEGI
jgi:hypothetical protein